MTPSLDGPSTFPTVEVPTLQLDGNHGHAVVMTRVLCPPTTL